MDITSLINNQCVNIDRLLPPTIVNPTSTPSLSPYSGSVVYDPIGTKLYLGNGSTFMPIEVGVATPITLTGNVTGSGISTIPTLLAPTINLPTSTGTEILSFDPSQTEAELILLNNAPITASYDKVHLRFQNVSDYGYYFSFDYLTAGPQGTFQLLSYNGSSTQGIFFVDALAPSFTFNIPVIMEEDLSMDNREIHNLNVAGSPALQDAVNVQYVGQQINAITITTDNGIATVTGNNVNFEALNIAGSSVSFSGSGSTVLLNTTDTHENTIIGASAGNSSVGGFYNAGFGYGCLNNLTTGGMNSSFGYQCLAANTIGSQNTALGYQCLFMNTTNPGNTAIGYQCLYMNNGPGNTSIGYQAGYSNITGGNNVSIGNGTMYNNLAGNNTAVGYHAMYANTSGAANTAFGSQALASNMTGIDNTAIGYYSLPIDTGHDNVALGNYAGSAYTGSESYNIVIGSNCNGTTGESNVVRIGSIQTSCFIAGIYGVSAGGNPVVVNSSGQLSVGSGSSITINTDSGSASGSTLSMTAATNAGSSVSFSGSGSSILLHTSDSNNNTLIGNLAGNSSITGTSNCGFGVDVLTSLTSGINNVGIGLLALHLTTIGNYNTAVGVQSLQNITSGSNNTCIGLATGSAYTSSESNNIVIGSYLVGTVGESNVIRIGSGSTSCFVAGITGVSVSGAPVIVSASGQLGVTVSSQRFKEDIKDMSDWSSSILKLKPKRFKYRKEYVPIGENPNEYHSGLIAEQCLQYRPDLVQFNQKGEIETVRYQNLISEMLNEIIKLNNKVQKLELLAKKI